MSLTLRSARGKSPEMCLNLVFLIIKENPIPAFTGSQTGIRMFVIGLEIKDVSRVYYYSDPQTSHSGEKYPLIGFFFLAV